MARFSLLFFCIATAISSCQSDPPTERYIEIAEKMNRSLPRKISYELRFDKVRAVSKHKFKYYYTCLTNPDIPAEAFIETSKAQITYNLQNSASSRQFREDNISIIYSYSRKDGGLFAEFEIKPNEY